MDWNLSRLDGLGGRALGRDWVGRRGVGQEGMGRKPRKDWRKCGGGGGLEARVFGMLKNCPNGLFIFYKNIPLEYFFENINIIF